MANKLHFEIYKLIGDAWQMDGVQSSRETALSIAKKLLKQPGILAVDVSKEEMKDDGTFQSVSIYGRGKDGEYISRYADEKKKGEKQEEVSLPCWKPDDFYSPFSREKIARLLASHLKRHKITPIELIHHADYLERLEDDGTTVQFAVQKVAVAKGSGGAGTGDVAARVKKLYDLVEMATKRVYQDARNNKFPNFNKKGLKQILFDIWDLKPKEYLLTGSIVYHLQQFDSWGDKVIGLLEILQNLPEQEEQQEFTIGVIDKIIAEVLAGSDSLTAILGKRESLGEMMLAMADLSMGRLKDIDPKNNSLVALNNQFKGKTLPEARTALAKRIIDELNGHARLSNGELDEEVKLLRKLGSRLAMSVGTLMDSEEVRNAFNIRSQRLVRPEILFDYYGEESTIEGKVHRLMVVENNIIGEANKRALADIIKFELENDRVLDFYLRNTTIHVTERLKSLVTMQASILESDIPDLSKRTVADVLDNICVEVLKANNILSNLTSKKRDPKQRIDGLVQVAGMGIITEGNAKAALQTIAKTVIADPEMMSAYLTDGNQAQNTAKIKKMLADTGLQG